VGCRFIRYDENANQIKLIENFLDSINSTTIMLFIAIKRVLISLESLNLRK